MATLLLAKFDTVVYYKVSSPPLARGSFVVLLYCRRRFLPAAH